MRIARALRGMLALGVFAAAAVAVNPAFAQTAICYSNCVCPNGPTGASPDRQPSRPRPASPLPLRQQELRAGDGADRRYEKANPVADVTYVGVTFGVQAKKDGLVMPYKPAKFDQIPADLKDPEGYWFTIHSGTLGFMVNVDALGGKPVPKSWKDLLKPEYKGMIGYLDPPSAFVGYVGAVAVNASLGGTLDNFTPAIEYFKALKKNEPIVPKQTSYARVLSGEIAILLDYDFNAYRAKYKDKANVEFVIPAEGTAVVPYVMSLVAKAPAPGRRQEGAGFRAVG